MPPGKPDFEGPIRPVLERELRLIELLLDDIGLKKLRNRSPFHPGVKRYDTIRTFLDQNSRVNYPDETDLALQLGGTLLDALSPGTPADDPFTAIDDQEVLRQLRLRVLDPEQFNDQMVALSCWDLLRGKGLSARLIEQNGLPDICVSVSNIVQEWVEAKRIRTGTHPAHARRVIKKANDQIKRADPNGAGSAYISIERQQSTVVFDDTIPQEIQSYIHEVDRELWSGYSKSVHSVIVAWDDYMLFADSPQKTCYYLRRRFAVRNHQEPRLASRLPAHAFQLGRTVALPVNLNWSGGKTDKERLIPIKTGNVSVTEQFRSECERRGHVRTPHAIAALQNPDSIARYDLGGAAIVLATRRITTARHPYTLLLIVWAPNAEKLEIMLGFRFYPIGSETGGSHPFDVFTAFLQRYGCPVRVGSYYGMFIPNVVINTTQGDVSHLVSGECPNGETVLASANIRVVNTAPRMVHVAWAFGVLMKRYEADIERHR